jgi:hypothetical protein
VKTVDLKQEKMTIAELLLLANSEPVLILAENGVEYLLEEVETFEGEVERLGKSKKFMSFLAERSKELATISLDDLIEEVE